MQSIVGRAWGSPIFSICTHTHAFTCGLLHASATVEPVSVYQALQLVSPASSYVTAAGGPVYHLVLLCSLPTRRLSSLCSTVSDACLSLLRSHLLRRHSSLSVGFITVREVTNAEDQSLVGHNDSVYCCLCARRLECSQQLSAACCSQSARAAVIVVTGNIES